ncbi:IS5 family transposase [Methanobrevibacter olleyae]|uniref:Transposase n=1 Tax=Methanobrevibacter olleyae TaxID=294671 RepID=A0A126R156_METOL|nr:IS5 family transposase [Methanobrevibacter olleyae]AMK15766.1 transposase [Methanobrevibacter olleyae]
MNSKILNPLFYFDHSLQLNLSDFKLENPVQSCIERMIKGPESEFNKNKLECFIIYAFEYAKIVFPDYYSKYSKHTYKNAAKFTILCIKTYLNLTYREICEVIELSTEIRRILKIQKVPHYSTLQKFFKKLATSYIHSLNEVILNKFVTKCEIIALDGSGFTNDYADKYYAIIRKKERKSYTKCHIAIDVDTRLILSVQAQRGPKHDASFTISCLHNIKQYKPHYIVADRAYDSENIRIVINEEINAFNIIPNKKRVKNGHLRKRSRYVFRKPIYSRRNNVESVFSVIKRIFSGINTSRDTNLSNKETKFKCLMYNIHRSIQLITR